MIQVDVFGIPRPGGSKTPGLRKNGSLFVRPASKHTSSWMAAVKDAAAKQYTGPVLSTALQAAYEFRFPRPKRHFKGGRIGGVVKVDAPIWHTSKPDLTKIIRSTEDALTGIVWKDDAQVSSRRDRKRYCLSNEQPGVTITILEIPNGITPQ